MKSGNGDVVNVVENLSSKHDELKSRDTANKQHAAAAAAAATEARGSPLVPEDQPSPCTTLNSHACREQGSVGPRDGQPGRSASQGLDNPGDQAANRGASCRAGNSSQGQEGQVTPASHGDRAQPSQEPQEGKLEEPCEQGLGGPSHRQRNHRAAHEQGPAGHLRSIGSHGDRPSGIRSPCSQELPRGLSRGEGIHELGHQDHAGRSQELLSKAHAPGDMAVAATPEDGERADHGSLFRNANRDAPDQLNDRSLDDIERLRREATKLSRPHAADDATTGADCGSPDRRSAEPQGGAASQEGSPCRERCHDGKLRADESVSDQFSDSHVTYATGVTEEPCKAGGKPCCHKLNSGQGRHLGRCSDRLIPDTLQSLALYNRVALLEIACSQDSVLTKTMHDLTGSEKTAQRMSLWNSFDLSTNDGVHAILDKIDVENPMHVWLSMECGPYSVMQNINQRNDEQRLQLENKRKQVLKQYVGGAIVFCYCIQKGIHITWEWSQSCQAWRLPLVQQLMKKYTVFFAIIRGCQVNLRNPKGNFVSKGWKIMTTHALMAERMNLPCSCDPRTIHVPCEGSLTRKSAFYTPEFAKRVCETILQGQTSSQLQAELQGQSHEDDMFGKGGFCVCKEHQKHDTNLQCGFCRLQVYSDSGLGLAAEDQEPCGMDPEEIQRKLYLLHAATGHSPIRYMVQTLKRKGVHRDIIKAAENFTCPVCVEKGRPQPRNVAALEPQPQRFDTVSADMGNMVHPHTGEHFHFIIMVDEGSRFKVGRVLMKGKKRQHVSAAMFLSTVKESWISYFGCPKTLRLDPDGAFRSQQVSEYCDNKHIFLDIQPSEGHWKMGTCERAIQSTKAILEKIFHEQPDVAPEDALAESIRAQNCRELIRGYSPVQHVLGKSPDETDRIFNPNMANSPELSYESAPHGHLTSESLRLSAEKAFLEWNSQNRINRAMQSRHKRLLNYSAGDLVYIWRKQVTGADAKPNNDTKGRFIGPARVLATEKKRDDQGHLIAGSAVWLVRGRRLLKCCPEQLRHASDREKIVDELYTRDSQPWTFPRIADELGGNEYDDWSEKPTAQEWERAGDPEQEWQPTSRHRGKRSKPYENPLEDVPMQASEPSSGSGLHRPHDRERSRSPVPNDSQLFTGCGFQAGPNWTERLPAQAFLADEDSGIWKHDTAVEVSIDLPDNKTASLKALKSLEVFFSAALKKRAVEVSERRLTEEEKLAFGKAKQVEVNNFLSAKAFEALPPNFRANRSDAVKMRWILTWKALPDGGKKAKARAVLLGYMDPSYSERATTSPTTTRQTRQIQLTISAGKNFQTWKGDVTGAFLQSRDYPNQLLCIPCPEILEAMNLPPDSLTLVKRACYGLVDAPLEWYRSISSFFDRLGLRRCWSDPCCWTYVVQGQLKGIISGHVDDFLFSGCEKDAGWQQIMSSIRSEYKWSDWEKDDFIQCGVRVQRATDGTYSLSQEKYVDDLKYINIRANRKKDKHGDTDDMEKSQLRTLLGGVSWFGQQVAPQFMAEVGLLLSEVSKSTIETLHRANKLMHQVKEARGHKLLIPKIPLENFGLFAWCDAAGQNRIDGSSTQGFLIGASSMELLNGGFESISPLVWNSSKIQRVCRSPGASEAAASVNAEDALFFCRFQFAEMLGRPIQIRQVNNAVNSITGCVITDSRNVFDKTATEVICTRGSERRVDLELMSLKYAQLRNSVIIRWVHSEAQLANSLTKNEQRQLQLWYSMKQRWRIVEDESMTSARKRKELGKDPLEDGTISSKQSSTQGKNEFL